MHLPYSFIVPAGWMETRDVNKIFHLAQVTAHFALYSLPREGYVSQRGTESRREEAAEDNLRHQEEQSSVLQIDCRKEQMRRPPPVGPALAACPQVQINPLIECNRIAIAARLPIAGYTRFHQQALALII